MSVFLVYQIAVAGFAAYLTATALLNFATFRRPRASAATGGDGLLPRISILVPARNEEANIEHCVRSLLSLNYPDFEVLVLDDNSSDATYDILCRLRDEDFRLRVLVGASLPDGWKGKPHACWQLAQASTGQWLLMTDADCAFAPDALHFALGAVADSDADVVSLVPDLRTDGFWERLLIPLQYFIIYAFLPTPLIRKTNHPWFAAANGAFLFLRRDTYFELDGHRAVREFVAEDVKFAQHVKRQKKTLWYGDGARVYSVRMYHGLREIWAGFSKNLYSAFSNNALLLFGVVFAIANVFVLPPFWAIFGWLAGAAWWPIPFGVYAALVAVRVGLTVRYERDSPLYSLLNPLAWTVVIGIALNSAWRGLTGRGATWKGRTYGQEKKS